jgi:hypothetical protein
MAMPCEHRPPPTHVKILGQLPSRRASRARRQRPVERYVRKPRPRGTFRASRAHRILYVAVLEHRPHRGNPTGRSAAGLHTGRSHVRRCVANPKSWMSSGICSGACRRSGPSWPQSYAIDERIDLLIEVHSCEHECVAIASTIEGSGAKSTPPAWSLRDEDRDTATSGRSRPPSTSRRTQSPGSSSRREIRCTASAPRASTGR